MIKILIPYGVNPCCQRARSAAVHFMSLKRCGECWRVDRIPQLPVQRRHAFDVLDLAQQGGENFACHAGRPRSRKSAVAQESDDKRMCLGRAVLEECAHINGSSSTLASLSSRRCPAGSHKGQARAFPNHSPQGPGVVALK